MLLHEKFGIRKCDMAEIGGPFYAYLFHRIDQRRLKKLYGNKELAAHMIGLSKSDGTILKNNKLYAWAHYKYRFGMQDRPRAADFDIQPADAAFLRQLDLSHLKLSFDAYSLEDFDQLVQDTVHCSHMDSHIGKLISRKLIFLCRSYGENREDIDAELRARAVRALYMHYPRFQSLLHMTNVAKTTIHHAAMTMITQSVNGVRNRLYVDEHGQHQAVHDDISLHVNKVTAPDGYLSHVKDHLETLVRVGERMQPELQRFMLCCAGHFDREFSEFLKRDNSVAIDCMAYERYLERAKKFFGYTDEQVGKVFTKLRTYLEPGAFA
jgi:hypothetical protein